MGKAMNMAKRNLFRLAYTLGIISPNNKIKNVTKPTSIKNLSQLGSIAAKKRLVTASKTKTIAILIKLLAINIVANSRFGRSKRRPTISSCLERLRSSSGLRSVVVSEKKAISAPEISAEHNKRTNIPANPISSGKVSSEMNKLGGSGSTN